MVATVNLLYEAWILRSAGIMPDEMWEPQLKNAIAGFRYPAGRHWLEMDSLSYDQEFIRFLRDEAKKDDGSA
jgi:hypothetical protein